MKKSVKLPFVNPQVEALLLWRDVKASGAVFGAGVATYLALAMNPYPLISLMCYLTAFAAVTMLIWAQLGAVISRSGPPVPALLLKGISEAEMRQYAEAVRPIINRVLAQVGVLASGKDLRLSLLVVGASYSAARVFAVVSPLSLVFTVFLLAFSLPKGYEAKQEEVDQALGLAKSKVDEVVAKFNEAVLSKMPKGAAKKTQ